MAPKTGVYTETDTLLNGITLLACHQSCCRHTPWTTLKNGLFKAPMKSPVSVFDPSAFRLIHQPVSGPMRRHLRRVLRSKSRGWRRRCVRTATPRGRGKGHYAYDFTQIEPLVDRDGGLCTRHGLRAGRM